MKYARRTDANQAEIVRALKCVPGLDVFVLSHVGGGVPDLLCWSRAKGFVLMEVKDGSKPPSARKLTPDEEDFAARFPVRVVCSVDEALECVT